MRAPTLALSLAAVAVVVGVRVGASPPASVPLIALPQGVSAWDFGGRTVFIDRAGSLQLTGFLAQDPVTADPLKWCPVSAVFLQPDNATMWDRLGRWVIGPSGRDLARVPVAVDDVTQRVKADPSKPQPARGRGTGTVSGEVKLIYDNWVAGRIPLYREFCRDAVG